MINLLLKAKYSFISALVFFIVANPETYTLIQTLFGPLLDLEQPMGPNGLLFNTVLFFFAMLGLMMIPSL